MATALTTTIESAAKACRLPFTDQIYKRGYLGQELWRNKIVTGGGKYIYLPVNLSATGLVGTRSPGEAISYQTPDTIKSPVLDWRYYWAAGSIPREYIKQASGRNQVVDLVKNEIQRQGRELRQHIWTHVYTGTGDSQITGLVDICSTSNTYAGLNRSTYTNWQGNVSTETSVEDADMNTAIAACSQDDERPNLIVTNTALWLEMQRVWALPYMHYTDTKNANYGFTGLSFSDIPVIHDDLCPSTYIAILNTKYLHWVVPDANDPFEVETFVDESDVPGVKIRIAPMLQLACTWPKYQYLFTSATSIVKAS